MEERHTGPGEPPPDAPNPPPARVDRAERRAKALSLKQAGASFRIIAQQLGISHQQAFRDVDQALKELAAMRHEKTEQYVAMEMARLDRLLMVVWPRAMRGDFDAIDLSLKILGRVSRLLGLDAPLKLEHSGKVTLEGLFAMANQIETQRHGTLFGKPLNLGGPESS